MEAKPDFKSMSTQKKLGYVWDYYRFHILGVIVLVFTLGSIIHHYATLKESVLDMLFLNAYTLDDEGAPFHEFIDVQGFDSEKQTITVTTSLSFALEENSYQQDYYTIQTLSALFAAGNLDVFASPYQIYNDFASVGYVADLRSVFTEEELASYGDMVIYTTDANTGDVFPSGFDLTGNRWVKESGYYEEGCYLSVTANTDTPELTKEFILYILNY